MEFKTKKIFLNFDCFEELSRIEVLSEHWIFGMILFTFSEIFIKIKIFFVKILIQNYISRHKMNEFKVPNRQKAIKSLVLVSLGSLL